MEGFRKTIIKKISKVAEVLPISILQKLAGKKLLLPIYHAVSDGQIPHIKHLYKVKGTKSFVEDLDYLLKHFNPVGLDEFREIVTNQKTPAKPSFLLSFDDGLREFHDIISPVLLSKGIPAICFLNSKFIDNQDLFYRYKASLLIEQIEVNPDLKQTAINFFNNSNGIKENILSIGFHNQYLLDELAQRLHYSFGDFLKNEKPYLSRTQVDSLIKKGFYFGAHSIDHPEYQYLDLSEQLRQTKESVQFVCSAFGLDYKLFAFPFTDHNVSGDFFNQVNTNHITDFTFGCAGIKDDTAIGNFQRIPFEMGNLTGEQILKSEMLYYLLTKTMGKNRIRRND